MGAAPPDIMSMVRAQFPKVRWVGECRWVQHHLTPDSAVLKSPVSRVRWKRVWVCTTPPDLVSAIITSSGSSVGEIGWVLYHLT